MAISIPLRKRLKLNAVATGVSMLAMLWIGVFSKHFQNLAADANGARQDVTNISILLQENVRRSISDIDRTVRYLRHIIESSRSPVDLNDLVNSPEILSELIVQVAIIDEGGIMRATNAGPQPAPPTDLSDREHYKFHMQSTSDDLFISRPMIGRASGKISIQLTRGIRGLDGSFGGVVVASFDPTHFEKFYGQLELGAGSSFSVIGLDGTVRAAGGNGTPHFRVGQDITGDALKSHIDASTDEVFIKGDAPGGERRLFSVRMVPGHPLAVSVSIPESVVYADSRNSLEVTLAVALVLSVLIAVAVWQARKSEIQRETNARQLKIALEHMTHGIMMVTRDSKVPIMNRKCIELLDLPASYESQRPQFDETLRMLEQRGEFGNEPLSPNVRGIDVSGPIQGTGAFESYERVRPNGLVLEVRTTRLDDGSFVRTFSDVSSRHRAHAKAEKLASEDSLTGTANRRVFSQALSRLASDDIEPGSGFAILSLDIDRFKTINDTMGHGVGDQLLQQVAQRLKQSLRPQDIVARLGGDEFAVLLSAICDEQAPATVAGRLLDVLSRPYDIESHRLMITVSIGIAVSKKDGESESELLIASDLALYAAKTAGRDTYRFFSKEMNEQIKARQSLETDLRQALVNGEIEVNYQPCINLRTEALVGFEALARWTHPKKGPIPPDKFIPVAEDTGLILLLGEHVLREACRQAQQWPVDINIAVNLSPLQFAHPGLAFLVESILVETGLSATRLELEITEGLLMRNTELTVATLHRLKALGIRIAMDDFGTGYSSLSYLQKFPFDRIKIDRSFVNQLSDTINSSAVIRSVVNIAASLGMETTAEGIETVEQLASLRALGCDHGQGYLFSRPVSQADISSIVAKWSTRMLAAAE